MDLNNIDPDTAAPLILLGLVAAGVLLAIGAVIENLNEARKLKQREREWNDLNKPE